MRSESTGIARHFVRVGTVIIATAALIGACAHSDDEMVSTGSVEATRAGFQVFEKGGNAVFSDPYTGIFSGVGDPRRSGFAEGPRAVSESPEEP